MSPDEAPAGASHPWRVRLALVLMVASGFAGLGYQIVWTQQCALWLGHESAAVLAVVAAFFGGIAVGALVAGPLIERSANPVRWYAACETAIALWSAALLVLMSPFSGWVLTIIGVQPSPMWQWSVAFMATFAVLLPATAAMGATLPAIERITARVGAQRRSIAPYYACNTAGAVVGVLVAAFWLIPEVGLARTALVCIALNAACAILAPTALARDTSPAPATGGISRAGAQGTLMRLFCTGLLGIGYELLVVRVLSQVAEDTVFTFAMLLAVYLAGTALGAAAHARWHARGDRLTRVADRLLAWLAVSCLLGMLSLWAAEDLRDAMLGHWGASMASAVGAEAALAIAAFALPTLAMGALFSELSAEANGAAISFGRALGINTIGAAIAPLLFGVVLAPLLGAKLSLLAIVLGYLALATRRAWSTPMVWAPAGAALALAIGAPALAFVDVPPGGRIVRYEEGVMAAVSVVEDSAGIARLRINNRQQEGSSATRFVDARQALLPLLLHPAPRRALFLGLGTGVTAAAAAEDPMLQVDAVELVPEVIDASQEFMRDLEGGVARRRLHIIAGDARRYVRTTAERYDVVVADNFHPARSGSAALYTVEHFRAVRAHLTKGGVFCQWLPLHQLDLQTLRSIVRSFTSVYPDGWAMLASNSLQTPVLGLIGRQGGARFDLAELRQRLAAAASPTGLTAFGIEDEFALLGSFIAGPQALAAFARDAVANTDDRPVVAYLAPRVVYADMSTPRSRLLALLHELAIAPHELVLLKRDDPRSHRLAAYWAARDRFLSVGESVEPSSDVVRMLAQVREPLLGVLDTSPDFRPAYDPLLRMAVDLASRDMVSAEALLRELMTRQPARAEAEQALKHFSRESPDGSVGFHSSTKADGSVKRHSAQ